MILLLNPLKNDPLETMVSIFFSRNLDNHKFEKNLSSASVDDARP